MELCIHSILIIQTNKYSLSPPLKDIIFSRCLDALAHKVNDYYNFH